MATCQASRLNKIVPTLAADVIAQLGKDKRVRLELPAAAGCSSIADCRSCASIAGRRDADPGTEELVTSEMAYMIIPAEARPARQALELLRVDRRTIGKHFGAFLLVEIWSAPLGDRHESDSSANGSAASVSPRFEVVAPVAQIPRQTVEALSKSLGKHSLPLGSARVALAPPERLAPPGMKPLAKHQGAQGLELLLARRQGAARVSRRQLAGDYFPSNCTPSAAP